MVSASFLINFVRAVQEQACDAQSRVKGQYVQDSEKQMEKWFPSIWFNHSVTGAMVC